MFQWFLFNQLAELFDVGSNRMFAHSIKNCRGRLEGRVANRNSEFKKSTRPLLVFKTNTNFVFGRIFLKLRRWKQASPKSNRKEASKNNSPNSRLSANEKNLLVDNILLWGCLLEIAPERKPNTCWKLAAMKQICSRNLSGARVTEIKQLLW